MALCPALLAGEPQMVVQRAAQRELSVAGVVWGLYLGDYWFHAAILFVVVAAVLAYSLVVFKLGQLHERWCGRSARKPQMIEPMLRDVQTQSQATYKWWWQKPEFRALQDGLHGCWALSRGYLKGGASI